MNIPASSKLANILNELILEIRVNNPDLVNGDIRFFYEQIIKKCFNLKSKTDGVFKNYYSLVFIFFLKELGDMLQHKVAIADKHIALGSVDGLSTIGFLKRGGPISYIPKINKKGLAYILFRVAGTSHLTGGMTAEQVLALQEAQEAAKDAAQKAEKAAKAFAKEECLNRKRFAFEEARKDALIEVARRKEEMIRRRQRTRAKIEELKAKEAHEAQKAQNKPSRGNQRRYSRKYRKQKGGSRKKKKKKLQKQKGGGDDLTEKYLKH